MGKRAILAALLLIATFASSEADYRLECPSQDVDRAIRGCTIAIGGAAANLPLAYANRCVAFWLKGFYARAHADCEQAIELGGQFAAAYLIRGIHHAEQRDYRAAISDFTQSFDLIPTGTALYNRGTIFLELGDHASAMADLDRAIAMQPMPPQAYVNRALARLANGEGANALTDLDLGVELLHGDPTAVAIRKQVREAVAGSNGNPLSALRRIETVFPLSKELPRVISLESFSTGTLHVTGAMSPAPLLPRSSRPARAPAPAAPAPATPRDSFGECLRLWHPETRASLQEWRGICRRLDFSPGRTHGTTQ